MSSYDEAESLAEAFMERNHGLSHCHSSLSDTQAMKQRKKQTPLHAQLSKDDADVLVLSPWNVATSPMLTTCHVNHHQHPSHHSKVRRNKRSFSLGDQAELLDHLVIPSIGMQEELHKRQTQESALSQSSPRTPQPASQDTMDKKIKQEEEATPIGISIMYGLINASIVLPVLMSFGSIIYRDEAFQPYLNVLIKLTVASGVVHQLCFSTLSSLPFAVGQVQDAGLIFLSSMAASVVQTCRQYAPDDDEIMLATATVGLSLCTAILGLALVMIGRLKLAQWVQLLPTCVVGGYLAFIGYFCGMSGVGLMAGTSDVTFSVIANKWMFILPGIIGGIFIYSLVRLLRHMAVLPTCIVFLFGLFYLILWFRGMSVEEATNEGWIAKTADPPRWWHTWDFLKPSHVMWSALPQLLLTEISMVFVVALSSSLDIAAIELELKKPLDYNKELKMIGISNLLSGSLGGYSGSYIFSQSIFSLRAGIRSRLAGYVLAGCEIFFLLHRFRYWPTCRVSSLAPCFPLYALT